MESHQGAHSVLELWKNGAVTKITDGATNAEGSDIVVVGDDVYIAGYEINKSGKHVAKYWKNGIATVLSDTTQFAFATGIEVIDGEVMCRI